MESVRSEKDSSSSMAELLYCATGSSAVIGLPEILRLVLLRGFVARVNLVLTFSTQQFVDDDTLAFDERISLVRELSDLQRLQLRSHTELARSAAAAVVAPATANVIGKIANGIVDDPVTTILNVYGRPILLFPAIHPITFRKKSFQRNLDTLVSDGHVVLGPVKGNSLSDNTRYDEYGAMPGPERVVAMIERAMRLGVQDLSSVKLE